jgi:hypothetical protein
VYVVSPLVIKHGTTTNVGFNENLRHVYPTMSLFYDVNLYGCWVMLRLYDWCEINYIIMSVHSVGVLVGKKLYTIKPLFGITSNKILVGSRCVGPYRVIPAPLITWTHDICRYSVAIMVYSDSFVVAIKSVWYSDFIILSPPPLLLQQLEHHIRPRCEEQPQPLKPLSQLPWGALSPSQEVSFLRQ